ncbi:hypothetical protein NPIL_103101 [Nephila pilipes]|uniref:Uncharacterized protein n=1 Tax=Nephila pilipes TaxID=299642 RepID=A0A8X6NV10_NEPPI|nr:hypothetical protein NPIL_103101 [Nephila pilipes]
MQEESPQSHTQGTTEISGCSHRQPADGTAFLHLYREQVEKVIGICRKSWHLLFPLGGIAYECRNQMKRPVEGSHIPMTHMKTNNGTQYAVPS